jgi:hypothetical protein
MLETFYFQNVLALKLKIIAFRYCSIELDNFLKNLIEFLAYRQKSCHNLAFLYAELVVQFVVFCPS